MGGIALGHSTERQFRVAMGTTWINSSQVAMGTAQGDDPQGGKTQQGLTVHGARIQHGKRDTVPEAAMRHSNGK